jgi:AcrR family transcriptional regulator
LPQGDSSHRPQAPRGSVAPSAGKPKTSPRSQAQRDRILTALAAVVTQRGYTDTTAVEIILRAGISTKTFYKHFPSKEAAFRALLQLHAAQALAATETASASAHSWPDRVCASLTALLDFLVHNPAIARMGIVDLQTAGPEAVAEFQRWLRRYADSLAPHPREGSSLTTPRTGVSDQIAGGISQLLYDSLTNDEPHQLTQLLPDIVEIALAPYMGPRRAAAFRANHFRNQPPPSAPTLGYISSLT